jgi:hypothetical protein
MPAFPFVKNMLKYIFVSDQSQWSRSSQGDIKGMFEERQIVFTANTRESAGGRVIFESYISADRTWVLLSSVLNQK